MGGLSQGIEGDPRNGYRGPFAFCWIVNLKRS